MRKYLFDVDGKDVWVVARSLPDALNKIAQTYPSGASVEELGCWEM